MAHIEVANRAIRVSLPAFATLSIIFGALLWGSGVLTGYMAYRQDITTVKAAYETTKVANEALADRSTAIEALVGELRGDMKYTRADIAEIKTYVLPKK